MRGKFIVLEGLDGCGKTTQCELLLKYLQERNIDAVIVREPGSTTEAEKIRKILKSPDATLSPLSELYLFEAARKENIDKTILPLLEKGVTVICDRFIYSTIAYQGYGRHIPIEFIDYMNLMTIAPLVIDAALFLDLPPKQSFERKHGRDNDSFEQESDSFFTDVYIGYVNQVQTGKNHLQRIDASKDAVSIHNEIVERLLPLFSKNV